MYHARQQSWLAGLKADLRRSVVTCGLGARGPRSYFVAWLACC